MIRRQPVRSGRLAVASLAVFAALGGCAFPDRYREDRDYMLFDSSIPPARGTPARALDDPLAERGGPDRRAPG